VSREILFRGFSENLMQWIVGSLDLSGQSGFDAVIRTHDLDASYGSKRVVPESIGQFTGSTDKNGVKIFEGNIASFRGNLFVVRWSGRRCGFRLFASNKKACEDKTYSVNNEIEVVGNLYENPELIEDL
jgi:uncharacterized phage protein (TIGR01671 family)